MLLTLALLACTPPGDDPDDTQTDTEVDTEDSGDTDTDVPEPVAEELCHVDVQCPGDVLDDPKAPCVIAIDDSAGSPMYAGPAGLELRGRSSLTFPKPQYSLELRDYNELPVWPGSGWSYLDDSTIPGQDWMQEGFDDSQWPKGAAPFGYGEDFLVTTVAPSTDGSVTTWFRRTFDVANLSSVTRVRVGLMRDDGAAVYLNGTEILRDNLPVMADGGTLAVRTTTHAEGIAWVEVDVDPGLLHAGDNTLAVEVHQADPASPDMRFDLYLEAMGDQKSVNFGGMGADPDWILNGMYVDRALFRDRLAFDLFRSFGGKERYAPESRYCELTLNGAYRGIYSLGEKVDRDDDRIDIPASMVPGESFVIKLDDEDGFHANAVGMGTWQMVYPDDDKAAEAAVSEYLTEWEQSVKSSDPGDPNQGIFAYIDMDSAVDFVILEEFMKNNDAYQLSVHLWRAPDGKMHFTPWDLDLSMGYPNADCGPAGWIFRPEYIAQMAAVPAFKTALVSRWAELREDELSEETILAHIARYDETLAPAIEANFQVWPIEEIAFSTDGVPQWLCPVDSYEDEHARVLEFVTGRLAWMDANIEAF